MTLELQGIGVSRGIAIGKAHILFHNQPDVREYLIPEFSIEQEVERLLDAINSTMGACWFYPESVADAPADLDILKTSTGLMARAVDVITELEKSLESGDIDKDERARINKKILKLLQQMNFMKIQKMTLDLKFQKFIGIKQVKGFFV